MNLSFLREGLAVALVATAGSLFAANISYNGGAGGDFASDGIWTGGKAPVDGDTAGLTTWNTAEVGFFLSSDYATELKRMTIGMCKTPGHMSFDTKGFDFAPKTSQVGTYQDANGVLTIVGPKGYGQLSVSRPTDPNHAPYVFRDSRFDMYKFEDGTGLVDFNRGLFDFGLDSGEAMSLGEWEPSSEFRFSGSSQLKVGKLTTLFNGNLTSGGSSDDVAYRLAFAGGDHTVSHFVYGNGNREWKGQHLVVVSNATLSVDKFEMAPYGIATFVTGPGGILNIGTGGIGLTNANYYGSVRKAENHVFVDRGTWNFNAAERAVMLGAARNDCKVVFGADGATFNQNTGRVLFYGNHAFAFTNTQWNATAEGSYWSAQYGSMIDIVGGQLNAREIRLAENGKASLTVDGGTHAISTLKFGNNTATDTATLTVKGDASLTVAGGIGVDSYSRAIVTVEGTNTVLETPNWYIAKKVNNPEDTTENNCVTIDAAHVKVGDQVDVATGSSRRGILRLRNGALLEAKRVMCSSGVGKTGGLGEIEADGATLRARSKQDGDYDGLISYQDKVSVGAGGFTVDTAGYDVRLRFNHRITNKAGARGVLTKAGAGVMKFYMKCSSYGFVTDYDVAETRIAGGEALMVDETTTLATDLTVENQATLSLVGAARTLNLNALAVTNGIVRLDADDRIVVDGPVSFDRVKLSLTTAPTAGGEAVDLLSVRGEMDEATSRSWSDAVLANAVADGYHASFTAVYDEQTDRTALKVSVVENTPMSKVTTWIGTDGDWAKPGNWSDGVPAYDTIARFADNGAAKTVVVSEGARAGALDFESGGFTLTGAAVALKATGEAARIRGTVGEATVDVPVRPQSAFVVDVTDAEAAVTLARELEFSDAFAFTKSGDGALVLNGGNVISGNVFLNGGLTDVYSPTNAFGAARTTTKVYLASAAKLHLHGACVDVPMEVTGSGTLAGQLLFAEGTTNELVEMRNPSGALYFTVEADAVAFCHDWRALTTSYKYGAGTFVLDGTVWQQVYATMAGTTSVAAVKMVRPKNNSLDETDGVQTAFRVDGRLRVDCDAFKHDWNSISFYAKTGVFDLNGHDVELGGINLASASAFGRLTSATPARFTHRWNGAQSDLTNFDIGGEVTFVFNAKTKNLNIDAPMSTMGGLVVTNGTLTMTANASWLNPTNATVFVGGPNDGRLVIGKSKTFAKTMDFDLREQGVLELANGVRQRCRQLYLDGAAEPAELGTWGATGSGAQHVDDSHFAGTGVLDVRGDKPLGLLLLLR